LILPLFGYFYHSFNLEVDLYLLNSNKRWGPGTFETARAHAKINC
jgi:hypothetical protein